MEVYPARPVRNRYVPICARVRHVGCRATASKAGPAASVCVPEPVDAVVQVRVDGFDHPRHLGLASSQVLRVVVPTAVLQCAQPERVELAALGAVQGQGALVVIDFGVGVAGIARANIDAHHRVDLDIADGVIDVEIPVEGLCIGRRGPLLVVIEDDVVVVPNRPLQGVVVAYCEIGEVPHQVVCAVGKFEGLVDPSAALLRRHVYISAKAVGVELVEVVAHLVIRSEGGLQKQVVLDLSPAVPLANRDVELVRGCACRIEPETAIAIAAGVAGHAPVDGDVVLDPVIEVVEVQSHLVGANIQQLRVFDPRATLVGVDAYRIEGAGFRAVVRIPLIHPVHVGPFVARGIVPGGLGDPDVDSPPYLGVTSQ